MKKTLFVLLSVCLLVAGVSAQAKSKAVYDSKKGQYKIEEGATLTLGVDNDKWGPAIVALWDKVHPEAAGAVEYLNTGSGDSAKKVTDLQGDAPDVVMSIPTDVGANAASMAPVPTELAKIATDNLDAQFMKMIKAASKDLVALPIAYDGMSFAWNKTMLMQLKLITGKVTKDNLPVEFDTWEKIFALAKKWDANRPSYNGKTAQIVFPMSLDEVWSGYSSLTSTGWQIFAKGDALKPGFDDPKFLTGLNFIKEAAAAKISVEANGAVTPGASMGWRWDDFLNVQSAPFGMVGTWQDVKGATTKGGFDVQFGAMPTYKGVRLTPFIQAKTIFVNAYTKYPSAATELMRLLFTKEGLQVMIDNSGYIPTLKAGAKIAPNFANDVPKQQMMAAFQFSYPTPLNLRLPANISKVSQDVYYNIGINQFFKDIWDGVKTPADAQKAIVEAAQKWIDTNNVK